MPKQLWWSCILHILIVVYLQSVIDVAKDLETDDASLPVLVDCVKKLYGLYKCFNTLV